MANRNSNSNATSSTTASKQKVFALKQPYAEHRIAESDVYDQASMRSDRLYALTLLITGDGFPTFRGLGDKYQEDVLWMIQQLAEEVKDLVPLISGGALPEKGAREIEA